MNGKLKLTLTTLVFVALTCVLTQRAAATAIAIFWDPSPSTEVTGYAVYCGYKSGDYSIRVDAGNQTTFTFDDLQGQTNYFFVATAYTAEGVESLPSNEVSYEWNANAPQVTITFPSANSVFETQNNTVDLAGTASDDFAVTQVTWSNQCNHATGIAAGTTDWSAMNVPLCVGMNPLSITAQDGAGNSANALLTIIRNLPCAYSLDRNTSSFQYAGGVTTVTLNTSAGCAWSSSGSCGWLTISPSSGVGPAAIALAAAPNLDSNARSCTVTIGGESFIVTQAGLSCSYAIVPSITTFAAVGGASSVNVSAGPDCNWTASSGGDWVTLTSPGSGRGNSVVTFNVNPNPNSSSRSCILTIAGQNLTITQSALSCTYAITPTVSNFGAAGGIGSVNVSAGPTCNWTASSGSDWAVITSLASGIGNSVVTFNVSLNSDSSSRSCVLTIAGQTFTLTQSGVSCTYAITPTTENFDATGGIGSVNVTAPSACNWTASSAGSWVIITSPGSGRGNSVVTFNVNPNPNSSSRSCILTIAGQNFTITQSALSCTYAITPTTENFGAAGGVGSVNLSAGPTCNWTASSAGSWVIITSPGSGRGNSVVTFNVNPNPNSSSRSCILTIAGQNLTITQSALSCTYAITPTVSNLGAAGGIGSVNVSAGPTCNWTADSAGDWATLTSPGSGIGNSVVTFNVSLNSDSSSRSCVLTIAGQTFTLTQSGVSCTYAITSTTTNFGAAGGLGSVNVSAGSTCNWTASSGSDWAVITSPGSGIGNSVVTFNVSPNSDSSARSCTVTIADQNFTLTQSGVPCTYAITPTTATFGGAGGSGSVNVTAPSACNWTASSGGSWVVITSPSSGIGTSLVTFNVSPNPNSSSRNCIVTIAGQNFTLTQSALSCSYAITPAVSNFGAAGGNGTVTVSAGAACDWTASSAGSWVAITSPGNGRGSSVVTFSVGPNPTISPRSCTVTIAGQNFTLSQSGVSCTYAITPTVANFGAAGGDGNVAVSAGSPCTWTASSGAAWAVLTSSENGLGNSVVTYSVEPNTNSGSRSCTLSIAGKNFVISQSAGAGNVSLSAASWSIAADGAGTTVILNASVDSSWTNTTADSWVTVSPKSGKGPSNVRISALANSSTEARSGIVTLAGKNFVVKQAGKCIYALPVSTANFSADGGVGTLNVGAGPSCNWTATSGTNWVVITSPASGIGNSAVIFTVDPNPNCLSRNCTLTIAGQTFTITQNGGAGTYSVLQTHIPLSLNGGRFSIDVVAGTGCSWTATSDSGWVQVESTPSTSGNGTVWLTAAPSTGNMPRTGILTVAGHLVTVTQDALTAASFASGTFNGLLTGFPVVATSGSFTLKKIRNTYTGTLNQGILRYAFRGEFDSAGHTSATIKRPRATSLTLQLNFDPRDGDHLSGTLADSDRVTQVAADRSVFHSVTNPAPYAGKYTLAVLGLADQPLTPGGIGFATVQVLSSGLVKVSGTLGDGEVFAQSTYLSKDGMWPFYVALYGRKGLVLGWPQFDRTDTAVNPHGNLIWIKPAVPAGRLYPGGFSNSVGLAGSPYHPPLGLTNRVLNFSKGTIAFSGAGLVTGLAKDVTVQPDNNVVPLPVGLDQLNFKIRKDIGTFSGTVKLPGFARAIQLKGALLQNKNAGYGLFLGTNQSGQVIFQSQ